MKVLRAGALGVLSQAFIPDLLLPLDRSVNKQGNPALSSQVIPLVLAEKADALSNARTSARSRVRAAMQFLLDARTQRGHTGQRKFTIRLLDCGATRMTRTLLIDTDTASDDAPYSESIRRLNAQEPP